MTFDEMSVVKLEEKTHAQLDVSNREVLLNGLLYHEKKILEKFFSLDIDHSLLSHFSKARLCFFIEKLSAMDQFYSPIGGVVGYQQVVKKLLQERDDTEFLLSPPPYISLEDENLDLIEKGILAIENLVEIYTCAGAADRLNAQFSNNKEALPTATLKFCNFTLFEWLIRDLEGREALYEKKYGKKIEVPIVIMTSDVSDNHNRIFTLCEKRNWFGRNKEKIRFIKQPLVPTFDKEGNWHLGEAPSLLWKPGGHGALWHLLEKEGIYKWLSSLKVKHALIRQVNNPIAGIDHSLLSFLGLGIKQKAHFGFASCKALAGVSEGRNIQRENGVITNIEYCDWEKANKSTEGEFLANTNVLFADLNAVQKAVKKLPFPGLLVNFKQLYGLEFARVESTMQNIAEAIDPKKIFIAKYPRHKILSPIKRIYCEKTSATLETPHSCLYTLLQNSHELLKSHSASLTPKLPTFKEFEKNGAPYFFSYHPKLGPTYTEIAKKLSHLTFKQGTRLHIEASSLHLENILLANHLHIEAKDSYHHIHLQNVTIEGDHKEPLNPRTLLKEPIPREIGLRIYLDTNSTFIANNVQFKTPQTIYLKPDTTLTAMMQNNRLIFIEQKK